MKERGARDVYGAHAPLNERAFEAFSFADGVLRYGTGSPQLNFSVKRDCGMRARIIHDFPLVIGKPIRNK